MLIKYAFIFLFSIYFAPCFSSITNVPNSPTKILKSAELADVPLQDVEAYQKENKLNEKGERILRRKIAPTDQNPAVNITNKNENSTVALKIATEGSGVTKLSLLKNASNNATEVKTIVVTARPIVNITKVSVSSTAAPTNLNLTTSATILNGTVSSGKATINATLGPQAEKNTTSTLLKPVTTPSTTKLNNTSTASTTKGTTTTTTTTSTTTTATTTTTTTTPKPKKPKITYSVEDMPEIANVIPEHSSNSKFPTESKTSLPKLSVDEPEQPIAQPSQEFNGGHFRNHRDYIIPFVSIIFAVPILMGMVIVAYRRFRDFWSTRHYRRMDFLVDGMYND